MVLLWLVRMRQSLAQPLTGRGGDAPLTAGGWSGAKMGVGRRRGPGRLVFPAPPLGAVRLEGTRSGPPCARPGTRPQPRRPLTWDLAGPAAKGSCVRRGLSG